MNIETINDVVIMESKEVIITDVASALDLVMDLKHRTSCCKIALNKGAITEKFFILSSGLAGEILQKLVNYGIKLAIYGDYSKYTSKPLKDFIYESNKGEDVFFVEDKSEAIAMLTKQTGKGA